MSTLGKILTVLVVLVSIAVAVLVAREFVLSNNWKSLYDEQVNLFNRALEQRDLAFQQRDKTQSAWDADKAAAQQQIETLTNELQLRKNTITALSAEKENQEKRLQELSEQFKGLNVAMTKLTQEKDAYRNDRDAAMKEADNLRTMYAELEARYRNTVADLGNVKETLRQTSEEKTALESRLTWVTQNYPDVKFPDQVPAVPTQKVQGLVKSADNEAKVAEINLGADDGVVKGMKFYIYDGDEMKYLATLTVTMVSKNSAAGDLSAIRGTVKANNHVTNRFE